MAQAKKDYRPRSASPVMDAVRRLAKNARLSYREIAEKVREAVPGSNASEKSVASEVRLLRRAGVDVPPRKRQTNRPRQAHA